MSYSQGQQWIGPGLSSPCLSISEPRAARCPRTMSSALCSGWLTSGASGIDASVSLPLKRERGAMVAAMSGPGPGVVLALVGRDLYAPVRVSSRVEIPGRRAGDYSMSRTI